MNLLDFLNRQSQFTGSGHFLISRSKLDNVDGLIPDSIKFIKAIKSDEKLWSSPLALDEEPLQSRMHRIITEYQILIEQYNKMMGEESFTFDDLEEMAQEIQSLYDDFISPLLEEICPDGCEFGSNPDGINLHEIGYWRLTEHQDASGLRSGAVSDLDKTPFNPNDLSDCACDQIPSDHILITDSQEVKAVFESIGQPDLYEYFQGLFVTQSDGEYTSIYGFVGIVPSGWKPCWRIL